MEKITKNKKIKLCIFPNDSLQTYFKKGKTKERYFKLNNFFGEIHFFLPIKKDIDSTKIKSNIGDVEISTHTMGKLNLLNFKSKLGNILEIIKKINPESFENAILKLINNLKLKENLIQKGLVKIKMLDIIEMEYREEKIYRNIQQRDKI